MRWKKRKREDLTPPPGVAINARIGAGVATGAYDEEFHRLEPKLANPAANAKSFPWDIFYLQPVDCKEAYYRRQVESNHEIC